MPPSILAIYLTAYIAHMQAWAAFWAEQREAMAMPKRTDNAPHLTLVASR